MAETVTEERLLQGKTALISGGGRGIGREIALTFAAHGAKVAVGARTRAEVEETAAGCRTVGVEALALDLDIADRASCEEAVGGVERAWGGIDVLVNNAGVEVSSKFLDVDEMLWAGALRLNLTGAFYLTRAALPRMLERGGAVIAIASLLGKIGAPYVAPYAASKHALIGLMRSLAAEYPRSGVTFNSVCPAYVETPMTERAIAEIMARTGRDREDVLRHLLTPQGRLVRPSEVAAVCLLLASEEGQGINGQAINVDGGQLQS